MPDLSPDLRRVNDLYAINRKLVIASLRSLSNELRTYETEPLTESQIKEIRRRDPLATIESFYRDGNFEKMASFYQLNLPIASSRELMLKRIAKARRVIRKYQKEIK